MVRQCTATGEQPGRGSAGWQLATLVILSCTAYASDALDRLTLEIGRIASPSVQATGATVTLDVTATSGPTLQSRLDQVRLPALALDFSFVDLACTDLIVEPPKFGCNAGTAAARGGPTGQISMTAQAAYDSSSAAVSLNGSGLRIAGGSTRFAGKLASGGWSADINADGLDLGAARKLAAPWLRLTRTESLSGHVSLRIEATGRLEGTGARGPLHANIAAQTTDLNFSNQPGTLVGQSLAAALTCSATARNGDLTADLEIQSTAGQALAGVVLLDFGLNPLNLGAHVATMGDTVARGSQRPGAWQGLAMTAVHITQQGLIEARGDAQLALGKPATVTQAHADIQRLEFAAAYRSFLQLALATTDFGALHVGGHASGSLDVANNQFQRVSARLENVSAADSTTKLSLANANGEVHWVADANAPVAPSQLSWSSSGAYGLLGGSVKAGFTAHGRDFTLDDDTRFPIFDGALVVHKLAVRRFGAADAELDLDAHLEPISMPRLSQAFGWPVLSGQLAGKIPGVTYRDRVLTMEGDLVANVFDGTITGSHIKLRDPLGPWPRLDADVSARRLDLDLVTHFFSIGSMTGRMDADLTGLELFNWSPVGFDARLRTTPGDRSEHLISQKAVTSISSVGGGGGGVAAAMQSGVMKFFHTFHYDRIGISCRLRDEVCLMSGIEPARGGYYLVKGRGIPRIDIIGNAGRVDWPQLVGQITASMHSENIIVR